MEACGRVQTEPNHERKEWGMGWGTSREGEREESQEEDKETRANQQGAKRPREHMGTKRVCGQLGWLIKDQKLGKGREAQPLGCRGLG